MTGKKFEKLLATMRRLRKECPWDAEQTHDSIKSATLEEAYEVVELIDEENFKELGGELGDLLLHIVFHSVIGEDAGNFTIDDVIDGITEKLIRRHPHVFGDVDVNSNKQIERNWESIKLKEEGRNSVLQGVPSNLPALHRAFRIQEKVSKVGFDWKAKEDVWKKVLEEIDELHEAEEAKDIKKIEEELGDLFFSLINYSRFLGINPENALRATSNKFVKRFNYIEQKLVEQNKMVTDSNLEEMDKYWEESKKTI